MRKCLLLNGFFWRGHSHYYWLWGFGEECYWECRIARSFLMGITRSGGGAHIFTLIWLLLHSLATYDLKINDCHLQIGTKKRLKGGQGRGTDDISIEKRVFAVAQRSATFLFLLLRCSIFSLLILWEVVKSDWMGEESLCDTMTLGSAHSLLWKAHH